ncbi:toprim domain-containing protein [Frateuria aurantia]|uniref:Toprim domain-containing protein n=1 Tax=Frateuria aurantia (strain ATCC 33424 / DSM 6220 / KCTC 2777 / LMG 1558 / NBRC 3245 / NCIMB 13370) TaxID=767434 RepID=H8L1V5_FRAAD|nr:toprim domain-containing protein [Frateuria aurantia]AFC86366.1 hypothetical protein Fraau_1979 [Frateuria aurantia DSM 6220]
MSRYTGNLLADLVAAMRQHGITPTDPTRLRLDGVLCRFHDEGDRRDKRNGWAVVYVDTERPVAVFGSWRKGGQHTVVLGQSGRTMTADELERQRIAIEQARAARDAEQRHRQRRAAGSAFDEWQRASPASPRHPYLQRKGVTADGLREAGGKLLVPMHDAEGRLVNLQRIRGDGDKRFLPGGMVRGAYCLLGKVRDGLLIAEGVATAKSLHASTGQAVAVAFSAGNLLAVALVMRDRYPDLPITICADNDAKPDGSNPGVQAATQAACAIGAALAVPPIPGDFNDYATTLAAQGGTPESIEVKNHVQLHD